MKYFFFFFSILNIITASEPVLVREARIPTGDSAPHKVANVLLRSGRTYILAVRDPLYQHIYELDTEMKVTAHDIFGGTKTPLGQDEGDFPLRGGTFTFVNDTLRYMAMKPHTLGLSNSHMYMYVRDYTPGLSFARDTLCADKVNYSNIVFGDLTKVRTEGGKAFVCTYQGVNASYYSSYLLGYDLYTNREWEIRVDTMKQAKIENIMDIFIDENIYTAGNYDMDGGTAGRYYIQKYDRAGKLKKEFTPKTDCKVYKDLFVSHNKDKIAFLCSGKTHSDGMEKDGLLINMIDEQTGSLSHDFLRPFYHNRACGIINCSDGGFIFYGTGLDTVNGKEDVKTQQAFMVKYTASGNRDWEYNYGSEGKAEEAVFAYEIEHGKYAFWGYDGNNDIIYFEIAVSTSVEDPASAALISPNPASSDIMLRDENSFLLGIFDVTGSPCRFSAAGGGNYDISSLAAGSYRALIKKDTQVFSVGFIKR